ncbi:MAG: lytic transglycosylase domain-containing protein [Hyphomicrobiales bacterium]|nr:lytic transglycosylase domain-containing protein [Hyphomicrobiales bacterium]
MPHCDGLDGLNTSMKIALGALALVSPSLAGCVTPLTSETLAQSALAENPSSNALNERIAYYASVYAVPERLVRRVIQKESGYNLAAHHGPFWGLMQLRLETARGMGYSGPVRGLLDTDTNLKYGIAYLANAYLVAAGDEDKALALYTSGYFYEARRKGLLNRLRIAEGA